SHYIGTFVETLPDVHTMAFRRGDQVMLWVMNQSEMGYEEVPITVEGTVLRNVVHGRSWTEDTVITGETIAQFVEGKSFTVSIGAESLNCFVFDVGPGVHPLSYAESFETGLGAWVQSEDDDYDWTVHRGTTPTESAGPNQASEGESYLYAEGHHGLGSNKTASIQASVDFSSVVTAELSFDYHMRGVFIDYLALDVFDGEVWANDVWIKHGQQHASSEEPWSSAQVDLSAFAGKPGVILRFRTANTAWNSADPAIDRIVLRGKGGAMLVGYDFDGGSVEPSRVISPYVRASALTSPMEIAYLTTVGDTSGVDAEGFPLGHAGDLGAIGIAVDDAATDSFEAALAAEDYLTFTVTPDETVSLNLEAITFKASKSNVGSVGEYAVTDEFGHRVGESVVITSLGKTTTYDSVSIDLSGSEFQAVTGPVTFRIYAWGRGASSPWGTVAVVDGVTLHGLVDFSNKPVAVGQRVGTPKNMPLAITLGGMDVEGDLLGCSVVSPPSFGTLSGTAPNFVYTPAADYVGPDSFRFVVDDGRTNSDPATVSILSGVAPDLMAGYDFDDGSGDGTLAVTFQHVGVAASDFGVGTGLVTRVEAGTNALADILDGQGDQLGTTNPLSFGGAQSNFGFTDMNGADDLSAAISANDYITFTITPEEDYEMSLTRLSFRSRVNSVANSAERWALFSSVTGFEAGEEIAVGRNLEEGVYVDHLVDLPVTEFQGLGEEVTFRLYLYGGDEPWGSATLFDKVVVGGEVNAIDEVDEYASWALSHGLSADDALPEADIENGGVGDGYSNFAEFALGMDPTIWDAGSRESCDRIIEDEVSYFEYLYYRRVDFSELGLSYQVMDSSALDAFGGSIDRQDEVIVGPEVDGFEPVKNRYLMEEASKFLRLRIQQVDAEDL
ncbi:MAG: Ig-like domain-containing protein, partial [Verrucomicrobiales bacterium]